MNKTKENHSVKKVFFIDEIESNPLRTARKLLKIREIHFANEIGITNENLQKIENLDKPHPRALEIYTNRIKNILLPKIENQIKKKEKELMQLNLLKNKLWQ